MPLIIGSFLLFNLLAFFFRCGEGMSGMRDQGVTNQIVYKFITDYDDIFRLEGEESPVMEWVKSHFNHLHY